jgi:hypothetical protein
MRPDDKKDFAIEMATCFQNYTRQVTPGMIEHWFDELKSFKFFDIRYAFRAYTREIERQTPTLAAIIRYSKKSCASIHPSLEDKNSNRCYVSNCQNPDAEMCPYHPAVMICQKHLDDMILKTRPDSVEARMIREGREFEAEAKNLGRANREHFEILHKPLYDKIRSRKTDDEAIREKMSVRVGELLDADITL